MEKPTEDPLDRLMADAGAIVTEAMGLPEPREPDPTAAAMLAFFEARLPSEGIVAESVRATMRGIAGMVPPPSDDPDEAERERANVCDLVGRLIDIYGLFPDEVFPGAEEGDDDHDEESSDASEDGDRWGPAAAAPVLGGDTVPGPPL